MCWVVLIVGVVACVVLVCRMTEVVQFFLQTPIRAAAAQQQQLASCCPGCRVLSVIAMHVCAHNAKLPQHCFEAKLLLVQPSRA